MSLHNTVEQRALQSERNGSVPWSNLQTNRVRRTCGKDAEQAPEKALKLFVSLRSLFQAYRSTTGCIFSVEMNRRT